MQALLALFFRLLAHTPLRLALRESGALAAVEALALALEAGAGSGRLPGGSSAGSGGGGGGGGSGGGAAAGGRGAGGSSELLAASKSISRYARSLSNAPSRRPSYGASDFPAAAVLLPPSKIFEQFFGRAE